MTLRLQWKHRIYAGNKFRKRLGNIYSIFFTCSLSYVLTFRTAVSFVPNPRAVTLWIPYHVDASTAIGTSQRALCACAFAGIRSVNWFLPKSRPFQSTIRGSIKSDVANTSFKDGRDHSKLKWIHKETLSYRSWLEMHSSVSCCDWKRCVTRLIIDLGLN